MSGTNPKAARRNIMTFLYENFLSDPLKMLTPSDFTDDDIVTITELIPNIHYLHERNYIELMLGYNPPLFAATRISNPGVDLYEDSVEFDRLFPPDAVATNAGTPDLVAVLLLLVDETDSLDISGKKREWMLDDIDFLRRELVKPDVHWRSDFILKRLQWLEVFLENEAKDDIASFEALKSLLHNKLL